MSNPYQIIESTCISFSGGRTSAYMLYKVLEAHDMSLPDEAIVCFQNTGKEDEATLDFVHECETRWNVKIHWIEYRNNDQGYAVVDYETASREGEPFEELIRKNNYLPSAVKRICTAQLKIRPQAKYMRDLGIFGDIGYSTIENMCWVGIRADEQRRAAKIADKSRVPLWAAGVTKETVGEFWRNQPFDLGLPNNNGVTMHGNCDLCFLKPMAQIASLVAEKPNRAIWWAKMEAFAATTAKKPSDAVFSRDRPSYAAMLKFSADQKDMFDPNEQAIACFCGD
jgi:3'-phosphoadenosine 5'-phosphosulfate sulfotransferase (PAPS reductase)/FAD synthetase